MLRIRLLRSYDREIKRYTTPYSSSLNPSSRYFRPVNGGLDEREAEGRETGREGGGSEVAGSCRPGDSNGQTDRASRRKDGRSGEEMTGEGPRRKLRRPTSILTARK